MSRHKKYNLVNIAERAMSFHGLESFFTDEVMDQLSNITSTANETSEQIKDLRHLMWCSIDNDDSIDLDQITYAELTKAGDFRVFVAVADVDALVKKDTPIDQHAKLNTTSIYTGVKLYPMLPEKLSTDLTSLSPSEDRLAMVIEMVINQKGEVIESDVYRAKVKNQAKLDYNSVAPWLEQNGPLPLAAGKVAGLDKQLLLQDEVAQKLRAVRNNYGALELKTIQARAIMKNDSVVGMQDDPKNRAHELIEDLMIAANSSTANFLIQKGYPSLRRVVRSPKRWERIVAVARSLGERLPDKPDSKALSAFMLKRKEADPLRFPDISLTIVKLLGRGEYVLEMPGESAIGHFGLAVTDYSHSTAPNRRFPDLITQRLVKAALAKQPSPYNPSELNILADHCTKQENSADKVERQVRKSASALLLIDKIGQKYEGLVTGASDKGTWARIFSPIVEGKISKGERNLDVGDKVILKLVSVDVEKGFIDFENLD
ncbi:RNB domain-containing ribonuclease [Bacteriovoracaceae bacterium]|nr:RNB domain-containing ribonuclease [Bacteriovoracaceae bacterium]